MTQAELHKVIVDKIQEIYDLRVEVANKIQIIEEKNKLINQLRNEIYDKNELIYLLKRNS